jgi:hypothetical protein
VLHAVDGVVSVDLDTLAPVDAASAGTSGHSARLRAAPATLDADGVTVRAAELLVVSPAHIDLATEVAHAG